MAKFRVLGRALQREDGRGKVTGEAHFTADIIRPDMLWGKILRSPLAHARIVSIDTSRARNLPGVKAVITARDVSPKLTGRTLADLPILARERVRFVGDKVAAVAAIDKDTAEEALTLIDVEYEELPAVFDPLEALKPGAPLIHPDYASYEAPETKAPDLRNVQSALRAKKGRDRKGLQRVQQDLRAYVPNPDGAPGLHRALCLLGGNRRRGKNSRLGVDAVAVQRARSNGALAGPAQGSRHL